MAEKIEEAVLPPRYAGWLSHVFEGPIPGERLATCSDCSMCGGRDEPGAFSFEPDVKCCSFLPAIPNFRVGELLLDGSQEWESGRATVRARIEAGGGVSPLGVHRTPVYDLLYSHGHGGFGRSRKLRCPHYVEDGGVCGVWPYREAVCATYFCKHLRGASGKRFWLATLQLLQTIEGELTRWCLLEHELDVSALAHLYKVRRDTAPSLDAHALDGRADPERQRKLWGKWAGRKEEFYRACARSVDPLGWSDILALAGPHLDIVGEIARQAHGELLSDKLPEAARPGRFVVSGGRGDRRLVTAYSGLQPLGVPRIVLDVLPEFQGRTVEQALAVIESDHGLSIHPSLVRKLLDHEILVPARPGK